ncbi:MAG: sulfatase-like hydrolase/transferase [Promethearchaeota archaeon]
MEKTPNEKAVFLITIDALRADHLRFYGYHRNTAPNLEKFSENGTTFLNTITNGPETPSSFSTIFSSQLPFSGGGYSPLPLNKIIFPQILKKNGIFTYGIHSNPHLGEFFNYNRGFDIFLDGERYKSEFHGPKRYSFKTVLRLKIRKILNYRNLSRKLTYRIKGFNNIKYWIREKFPFLTELFLPFLSIAYNATFVTKTIISFLQKYEGPLFLWAHFMDVHSPFNPPSKNILNFRDKDIRYLEREFLNEHIRLRPEEFNVTEELVNNLKDLYDGEINFLDESLDNLLKLIKKKYKRECLIIITADHGESFYEHGYFHHTGSIYDELLKVPLFLVEIGKKPQVKKIEKLVQLKDIPVTILDYFNINIPQDYQGKSLLPLLSGNQIEDERYVISECYQKSGKIKRNNKEGFILISIRSKKWKYIYDEEKNLEHFYDLLTDPMEKNNLIEDPPEDLEEFREIKDLHLKRVRDSQEKLKILKSISKIKYEQNQNN